MKRRKNVKFALILLLAAALLLPLAARWIFERNPSSAPASAPLLPLRLPPDEEEEKTPREAAGENMFSIFDQAAQESLTLSAEELLPVSLACEMDPSAPDEALKAQAVASYSRFLRCRLYGEAIPCDSEAFQVWSTPERLEQRWGEDWPAVLSRMQEIWRQVEGEFLSFEGEPILAAGCAISGGATLSANELWGLSLPYLACVASPGDCFAEGYRSQVFVSRAAAQRALETAFPEGALSLPDSPEKWLTDVTRSASGYVLSGKLAGNELSGSSLRELFGLRSACCSWEAQEDGLLFTVSGWGGGLGMSRAGVVFLAQRGADYREILAWYYPGTQLVVTREPSCSPPC